MEIYKIEGCTMYKEVDVAKFYGDLYARKFRGCTITEYDGEWYIPKADVDHVENPHKTLWD